MSTLLFVRHGQASIHAEDYDVLTDLGRRQAALFGEYLQSQQRRIDHLVAGPLKRQRDSAKEILASVGGSNLEINIVDGLREFPAFQIVNLVKDDLARTDPIVRRGLIAQQGDRAAPAFREAIAHIVALWAEGKLNDLGDLETFTQFQHRVLEAIEQIAVSVDEGQTALVVTSGGVIAVAIADALGLSPFAAAELMWEISNASFHELRLRDHALGQARSRRSLKRFNAVPHLEPLGLMTYV